MEMSSINGGTKKRIHLWKKSAFHFSLCFTIGFFTGFAPSNSPSSSSFTHVVSYQHTLQLPPIETLPPTTHLESETPTQPPPPPPPPPPVALPAVDGELGASSGGLLIIITTTRSGDPSQPALLGRLARTLKSVAPPLLWIVVEARSGALRTAGELRRTGVLYRHLTFRENFTDPEAEAHHQRNVALGHIEQHRIHGIVHFAGASNVYDLRFFEEIRGIEAFGAWPVALVSANGTPAVTVEGPVCSSSQVVGWYSRDVMNIGMVYERLAMNKGISSGAAGERPWRVNIRGFGFNSSVLWDPERWGRPTSVPDTSQDSMGFIQQVILEDETKVRAIPSDCSRIMLWHFRIPKALTCVQNQSRS